MQVTVRALDQFGNLVLSEGGSVTLSTLATGVTGLGAKTFASGVATAGVSASAGGTVTIEAQKSGATPASLQITFSAVCDGVTEFSAAPGATSCTPLSAVCGIGAFQSADPTPTTDRGCSNCPNGQYQDLTNQTSCKPHSATCTPGNYQSRAPSRSQDRLCATCTVPSEYQDLGNQQSCKATSTCVAGQFVSAQPTATSDRGCQACARGFVDEDLNPETACTPCGSNLVSRASFNGNGVTGTITLTQARFDAHTVIQVALTGLDERAVHWSVHTNAAHGGACGTGVVGDIYNPTNKGVPGSCSGNQANCAVGDLSRKLPGASLAGQTAVSTQFEDETAVLSGATSLAGRALVIYNATGAPLACATLSVPADQNFRDATGQVTCVNVTRCAAGQKELTAPTYTSDRVCANCALNVEFQPAANQRFCAPVLQCGTGLKQDVAPTRTSDRQCVPVTCPGLEAPEFGFVTECNGSRAFASSCTFSCDGARNFVLDASNNGGQATRTCQQSGAFSGATPSCKCSTDFPNFIPAGESTPATCVDACPPEQYPNSNAQCISCRSPCLEGSQYEPVPCGKKNRVCATCRTCPNGQYASGGCLHTSNNNTECTPWTVCSEDTEYALNVPNRTTDRFCATCTACPVYQYAVTGCCGLNIDTLCRNLTVCGPDEIEITAPGPAPQSTYGSDRVCRPRRGGCVAGMETTLFAGDAQREANCTPTVDTCDPANEYFSQGRCNSLNSCSAGTQFQYRAPSLYADRECMSCRSCTSAEYKVGGCDGQNNTLCAPLTVCSASQYELTAPTATTDRVCANCTVCSGALGVAVVACSSNSDAVCGTGEPGCGRFGYNLTNGVDWECSECRACAAGKYATVLPACLQGTSSPGSSCQTHSTCGAGSYEAAAGTTTTDRVCRTCAACPAGSFRTGCSGTSPGSCQAFAACGLRQYEVGPPSPWADRVCANCTRCQGDTYASRRCTATSDTVCSARRKCASNQYQVYNGSHLDNRVCADCLGLASDPASCPAPAERLCGEPAPTAPPPPPPAALPKRYHVVRFVLQGDYDTVVGSTLARATLFGSLLKAWLAHLLGVPEAWIVSVTVTKGSINVAATVGSNTDPVGADQAADDLEALIGHASFSFPFEDADLAVQSGSTERSLVEDDDDTDAGVIAGAVVGALVGLALVLVLVVVVLKRRDRSTVAPGKGQAMPSDQLEDEYLNVTPAGTMKTNPLYRDEEPEVQNVDGNPLFESQVAEENRRLQREVELMKAKIAQKSSTRRQMKGGQTDTVLDKAIAAKIRKDNEQLEAEIKAMRAELKRRQNETAFQSAATKQLRLKAEKAALEEELARVEEVSDVAAAAMKELEDRQRQAEAELAAMESKRRSEEQERKERERRQLQEQIEQLQSKLQSFN